MDWKWMENSVLHNQSPYLSAKDLFHAVTDELGRYYSAQDFRYAKSKPKLSIKDNNIQLNIAFWSSRSNVSGQYVWMEILPTYYALDFKKVIGNGILLSHTDILSEYDQNSNSNQCEVIGIFGDRHLIDTHNRYETVRYNHGCDLADFTIEKFYKIIDYIDNRIIPWLSKIQTAEGITEMVTRKRSRQPDYCLSTGNKYGNSCLAEYICHHFSDLAHSLGVDK